MTQEKALQALHDENERLGLYKDAYAQPEQEPIKDWVASHNAICALLRQAHDALALTSYPMKRTWVGLAAEDRLTAKYMQDAPDGIEAVIDYIEAKLAEKNSA